MLTMLPQRRNDGKTPRSPNSPQPDRLRRAAARAQHPRRGAELSAGSAQYRTAGHCSDREAKSESDFDKLSSAA